MTNRGSPRAAVLAKLMQPIIAAEPWLIRSELMARMQPMLNRYKKPSASTIRRARISASESLGLYPQGRHTSMDYDEYVAGCEASGMMPRALERIITMSALNEPEFSFAPISAPATPKRRFLIPRLLRSPRQSPLWWRSPSKTTGSR